MQWPTDRATLIIYMEALRKALKQWKADERAQEAAALDEAFAGERSTSGDDVAGAAEEPYYDS